MSTGERGLQCQEKSYQVVTDNEDITSEPEEASTNLLTYQGYTRTTTDTIKIIRSSGHNASADLLEEIKQAQKAASRLLLGLQELHKKKTGQYSVLRKKVNG